MFQKMKEFSYSLHRWILHGDYKEKTIFVVIFSSKKVLYLGVYQDIRPTPLQYRAVSVTICASTEIKMLGKGEVKSVAGQVVHTIRTYLSLHSIK